MHRFLLILSVLLLATVSSVFAQTGTIKGKITEDNGEPLIGANVVLKGTTTGTITDFDGNFQIQGVAYGQVTLVASFIGYTAQEKTITLNASEMQVMFTLAADATELEELVVIGYGVQKKSDKTGSISTVSAKEFTQGSITSPQDLVVGKISGVQITSGGGAPGSGSTIRIRGGSSLNASNDPLVIIDGIPVDNNGISGLSNPLSLINPNDIETFTILKDASATAIYGSRASNGVIIITTKKGTKGKTQVSYQGTVSLNTVGKTVEVLNADNYRETMNDAYPLLGSLMGDATTDWFDEIFDPAFSTKHDISVSGNIKELFPVRFSAGYDKNNGILKTSKQDRITTALNVNPEFFNNHLKVNISAKYANIKSRFADEGAIGSAMTMDPTQTPVNMDEYSKFGGYYAWTSRKGDLIPIAPKNPLAQLEQKNNNAEVNQFIGNVKLDYSIHYLPDVNLTLNVGTDRSKSDGLEEIDPLAAWDAEVFNKGGLENVYSQSKKNDLIESYMNYDHDFDQIFSNIKFMAGYSWQHFWRENESHSYFLKPEKPEDKDRSPYNLDRTENYLISSFGRFNYTLLDRYALTGTLRFDGSSRFSEKNRWGIFPAFAFAWTLSNESFMQSASFFNELKLRLGYGVTGQQDVSNNDYPYFGTYTISQPTASYVFYNPVTGTYERVESLTARPNGYDEKLKWEETETYNIGVDFAFDNSRYSGSLDFYSRKTNDLLNKIPVASGSNFSNEILTNVGNLINKGIELNITTRIISRSDLNWKLSFNAAYNYREITKLTAVNDPNFIGVPTGGIAGGTGNNIQIHRVGESPSSFFVYKQKYDDSGNPIEGEYEDISGDGKVNEKDLRPYKKPAPDVLFGLNSVVTYKNWEFSLSGHGSIGNYMYNNVSSNTAYTDRLQTSGSFISNIGSDIYNTGFQKPQYFSDYYIQNASFFRFDNIQVSYMFSKLKFSDLKLKVFGSVNNLYTITAYQGIDPEVSNGIDNTLYPRPRTYMLGFNLTF